MDARQGPSGMTTQGSPGRVPSACECVWPPDTVQRDSARFPADADFKLGGATKARCPAARPLSPQAGRDSKTAALGSQSRVHSARSRTRDVGLERQGQTLASDRLRPCLHELQDWSAMFGLFSSASISDPVLGELKYTKGRWRGMVQFAGASISLAISGSRKLPDANAVEAARKLSGTFTAFRPVIEAALFKHCEPYAEAMASGDLPPSAEGRVEVRAPSDGWSHVVAQFVSVEFMAGTLITELGMAGAWDATRRWRYDRSKRCQAERDYKQPFANDRYRPVHRSRCSQAGRAATLSWDAERANREFTRDCLATAQPRRWHAALRAVRHLHAAMPRAAALVRRDHLQAKPGRCAQHAAGRSRHAGVRRRPAGHPGVVGSPDPCPHEKLHRSPIESRSPPRRRTLAHPRVPLRLPVGDGRSATAQRAGRTARECSEGGGLVRRPSPGSKPGAGARRPRRGQYSSWCVLSVSAAVCVRLRSTLRGHASTTSLAYVKLRSARWPVT